MDERLWISETPAPGARIVGPGWTADCTPPAGATLISGDLTAAIAALCPGTPLLGMGEPAPEGTHALRIARDRALLVTPAPLGAAEGWDARGFAATAADDAYIGFRITGDWGALLAALTSVRPEDASPSTATLVAGSACLVSLERDGLSLRVPASEAAAHWLRIGKIAGRDEPRPASEHQ